MFETERLKIRKFKPDDLPWLIEMRGDPEVYKYLGGWERQNPEAVAERFQFYLNCYEKFGFGVCAMELKETGEMIGSSGLQPLEDTGEIEVGYNLAKRFWRQRYGEECARAWIEYGFERLGLERIVAVAYPENVGSWRIMEKCGMTYQDKRVHYGVECVYYAITREEFKRRFRNESE
jgi:ribosomal-protein-alanine N-acetyltransferase